MVRFLKFDEQLLEKELRTHIGAWNIARDYLKDADEKRAESVEDCKQGPDHVWEQKDSDISERKGGIVYVIWFGFWLLSIGLLRSCLLRCPWHLFEPISIQP